MRAPSPWDSFNRVLATDDSPEYSECTREKPNKKADCHVDAVIVKVSYKRDPETGRYYVDLVRCPHCHEEWDS